MRIIRNGVSATLHEGDEVDITLVGATYVGAQNGSPFHFTFHHDGTGYVIPLSADVTVNVAEPAYAIGAVYKSATGVVYLRISDTGKFRWKNFAGDKVAEEFPMKPMTKLVPETKDYPGK